MSTSVRRLGMLATALVVVAGCAPDLDGPPGAASFGKGDATGEVIPPPPSDAVAIVPRFPLHNGAWVAEKHRWLWLPPGAKLAIEGTGASARLVVPQGTRLWKDFYLAQPEAEPILVERRMIERVSDGEGFFGWRFLTAHTAPTVDGSPGSRYVYNAVPVDYRLDPNRNAPVVSFDQDQEVRFEDGQTYIFPGLRACGTCHAGAAGSYPGATSSTPVLAFGMHPLSLDEESTARIQARGWIDRATVTALRGGWVEPSDPEHARFLGELRHNCLSCHSLAPGAAARHAAFRLDPNVAYSREDLRRRWSTSLSRTGAALYNHRTPRESELMRAVEGRGRLRMPPREGGLPDQSPLLLDAFASWFELSEL